MLLSFNTQGVGFLFMAWLVSIIDINNTLAQTDSKLDAMTPSKTTLICDPLHQEFTNVFCEIYCWCDITHPQCKGYESECICTNEIYLSHTVLIIYLILFNHYYTKGRVTKKWTHIFFTKLDDIFIYFVWMFTIPGWYILHLYILYLVWMFWENVSSFFLTLCSAIMKFACWPAAGKCEFFVRKIGLKGGK